MEFKISQKNLGLLLLHFKKNEESLYLYLYFVAQKSDSKLLNISIIAEDLQKSERHIHRLLSKNNFLIKNNFVGRIIKNKKSYFYLKKELE